MQASIDTIWGPIEPRVRIITVGPQKDGSEHVGVVILTQGNNAVSLYFRGFEALDQFRRKLWDQIETAKG